jgi:hypothetical protein
VTTLRAITLVLNVLTVLLMLASVSLMVSAANWRKATDAMQRGDFAKAARARRRAANGWAWRTIEAIRRWLP